MGSYNTACFASQQTIAPGDPCLVIPLVQQNGYHPVDVHRKGLSSKEYGASNSICHPTAFWQLWGPFIEAKYDDRGQMKLDFNPVNRRRLRHLFASLLQETATTAQGDNKHHDLAFDFAKFVCAQAPHVHALLEQNRDDKPLPLDNQLFDEQAALCWDYMWEVTLEHRMFGVRHGGPLRPIQFAVLHRSAYDSLIDLTSKGTTWGGVSMAQRSFFDYAMSEAQSRFNEMTAAHKEPFLAKMMFTEKFRSVIQRVGGDGDVYYQEEAVIPQILDDYLDETRTLDETFIRLVPLLDSRWVLSALNELNLKLSPMVYNGQDYANEAGRAYSAFVNGVEKAVTAARRAEGYGEDDSDQEN